MYGLLNFLCSLLLLSSVAWADSVTIPPNCDTAPTLLCLAGRLTTTNDFTISTSGTQGGSILGSSVANAPLKLNSGTATAAGGVYFGSAVTQHTSPDDSFLSDLAIQATRTIVDNGPVAPIGFVHYNLGIGISPKDATSQTTTVQDGSEYHTRSLVDFRTFLQSGVGESCTIPAAGESTFDEYGFASAEPIFSIPTGSCMSMRILDTYRDIISFSKAGTGNLSYLTNYRSFRAGPTFATDVLGSNASIPYTAFYAAPVIQSQSTGSISVRGLHIVQDADATSWIGVDMNLTNYASANRAINSSGNAPSVHVGTLRLGDTTVATQPLEVLGNAYLDNSGTTAELRFREPSAGGSSYVGLKAGSMTTNDVYTLPAALPGTSGQPLISTTAGVMSWVTDTPSDAQVLTWHTGGSVTWDTPTGGTVDCTSGSTLLCLAGRDNTANDFIISTLGSQGGSIRGSSVADAPLNLSAGHATDPGTVVVGANVTDLTDADLTYLFSVDTGSLTISGAQALVDVSINDLANTHTTTLDDHGGWYRYGYVDARTIHQPTGIGGEGNGDAVIASPDVVETTNFMSYVDVKSASGSAFNWVNWHVFWDSNHFADNSGDINHFDRYASFFSAPSFTAVTNWSGGLYYGLLVAPVGDAGDQGTGMSATNSGWGTTLPFTGLELAIGSTPSTNRSISSTGAAPSTITGTVRIGDTTAATQALEVKGNIKIDNNGATPGELRFDEPSGDNYTAFKVQAQSGDVTYTLPAADASGMLASNGSGTLSWSKVVHSASWFFPGVQTTAIQIMRNIIPAGLTNCVLTNTTIVSGTPSGSSSTYNVERCTADCTGTVAPTWSDIYSSDITLPASDYHVDGGTPNTTTVSAGDQFAVEKVSGSHADVTVTLTYTCDN